jgi:hypothetical protein
LLLLICILILPVGCGTSTSTPAKSATEQRDALSPDSLKKTMLPPTAGAPSGTSAPKK